MTMNSEGSDIQQQKANVLALIRQQRLAEAHDICSHICDVEPALAENWFMLASVAGQLGRLEEALGNYDHALRLHPGMFGAWFNKGLLCQALGDREQAELCYRGALNLEPDYTPALISLGTLLFERGCLEEAESCYRQAIALQPDAPDALANLGKLLQSKGLFLQAEQYFRKALLIQPELPDLYNELGLSLNGQGRPVEAAEVLHRAIDLQPDFHTAGSNLLLTLNYSGNFTPGRISREHRQWGQSIESGITPCPVHSNNPGPERRLRVAYISPDFRAHSVASFFEPLLECQDTNAFETFCYSDVRQPDTVTQRLSGLAGHWRSVAGMPDKNLVDLVRGDHIDILVDLAGHTARNRLPVFAARPAPVQVTWLGYPNTTGLTVMDYRLTDEWADPEGKTEQYYTETLVRLPGGFLCYQPPQSVPRPAGCPSQDTGHITFGSFNSFVKMTPAVFQAWAKILHAVPGSRLILKNFSLDDPDIRTQCLGAFQSLGINSDRLELSAVLPSKQAHLELYNRIDIALDTFPYNGTTTTCEALWMGIPVITLAGKLHAGRVGVSLMNTLGLPQLVAADCDAYCELAASLASDVDQLQQWRASLRVMMESSSLCNGAGFTRNVELAYRRMWVAWCAAD